jgi:phosphoglycolate phosphatase-like HAD superfamily hydrolase
MSKQRLEAKALLVDLDGTLVDSVEAFGEAAEAAFSTIGHEKGSKNVGLEIARRLQRSLPLDDLFDENDIDEALREKFLTVFLQSFYTFATNKTCLFPNVDKTLCKLSKNFRLALITRRQVPKMQVKKELQRLHLDGYFATIVTALEVQRSTPFPDAILKAAEALQVPVHECVVISDSGVDLKAGRSAGAKTVAVLSGLFGKEELEEEKPDLIVRSVNDLPQHLLAT